MGAQESAVRRLRLTPRPPCHGAHRTSSGTAAGLPRAWVSGGATLSEMPTAHLSWMLRFSGVPVQPPPSKACHACAPSAGAQGMGPPPRHHLWIAVRGGAGVGCRRCRVSLLGRARCATPVDTTLVRVLSSVAPAIQSGPGRGLEPYRKSAGMVPKAPEGQLAAGRRPLEQHERINGQECWNHHAQHENHQ